MHGNFEGCDLHYACHFKAELLFLYCFLAWISQYINNSVSSPFSCTFRYYYAVVECDSSATADYLYQNFNGVEFERTSNKLDLRFIPDSMEFKHPPRDVATEVITPTLKVIIKWNVTL